jgi:hypothetical protein
MVSPEFTLSLSKWRGTEGEGILIKIYLINIQHIAD